MSETFTPRAILRLLERKGFQRKRQRGSHVLLEHPTTKRRTIVPLHQKDLPKGTLREIFKQSGIGPEDL